MRRTFVWIAVLAVGATSALAVTVRVDTNGAFVNDATGHDNGTSAPTGWTKYTTGSGTTGGQVGSYDVGNTTYNIGYETEAAPYPGGHSWKLGGNTTATAVGTWGIKQTVASTAGKLYWMTGAANSNIASSSVYAFNYGVRAGTANSTITNNYSMNTGTTSLMDGGRFTSAVVATSTSVTANVGHSVIAAAGTAGADVNTYVDGVRIYEMDIPVNTNLVNGTFESAFTEYSGYNAQGGTAAIVNKLPDGWLPLGNASGRYAGYGVGPGSTNAGGGSQSMYLTGRMGKGQLFAFQRINKGAGPVSLSVDVQNVVTAGGALGCIGIDFSGGTNPAAAGVVWSTGVSTANAWLTHTLSGTASTNGITVFLRAGQSTGNLTAYFGSYFDNVNLTYTPEPASVCLLVLGTAVLLPRRRRHSA